MGHVLILIIEIKRNIVTFRQNHFLLLRSNSELQDNDILIQYPNENIPDGLTGGMIQNREPTALVPAVDRGAVLALDDEIVSQLEIAIFPSQSLNLWQKV